MIKEEDEKFGIDKLIASDIIIGNIDSLSLHIKEGWDINKPLLLDEDGYRYRYILPIMLAVYHCNVNSVHFFLKHKAKLDIGKEHVFLYAVRYANVEIIECLIQNKAKVNVLSPVYTNAYSEAYMGNKYIHFELIQQYGLPASLHARDAMNLAIYHKNYEALDILIKLSVDLNNNTRTKNNIYGDTPLINGVYYSDLTMIKYLINHGADSNFPNLIGITPYTIALKQNKQDVISLLKPLVNKTLCLNDLKVIKMPTIMVEFLTNNIRLNSTNNIRLNLTNNIRLNLTNNSTIPYIVFLPITEIREAIFNKKKRFVITSEVGEFPSIHLLWNPYKQCISYYQDDYSDYGDICCFSKFIEDPVMWLESIFMKAYINK